MSVSEKHTLHQQNSHAHIETRKKQTWEEKLNMREKNVCLH